MLFQNDKSYTPKEIRTILQIPENKFNQLVKDKVIPLINLSDRVRRGDGEMLNKALNGS